MPKEIPGFRCIHGCGKDFHDEKKCIEHEENECCRRPGKDCRDFAVLSAVNKDIVDHIDGWSLHMECQSCGSQRSKSIREDDRAPSFWDALADEVYGSNGLVSRAIARCKEMEKDPTLLTIILHEKVMHPKMARSLLLVLQERQYDHEAEEAEGLAKAVLDA